MPQGARDGRRTNFDTTGQSVNNIFVLYVIRDADDVVQTSVSASVA